MGGGLGKPVSYGFNPTFNPGTKEVVEAESTPLYAVILYRTECARSRIIESTGLTKYV